MAQKNKGGSYTCMFCSFTNNNPSVVNDHQHTAHDFLLVPMLREDLVALLQFLFTNSNNRELINERIYKTLKDYSKKRIDPPLMD